VRDITPILVGSDMLFIFPLDYNGTKNNVKISSFHTLVVLSEISLNKKLDISVLFILQDTFFHIADNVCP
jgi:hypothetical protein